MHLISPMLAACLAHRTGLYYFRSRGSSDSIVTSLRAELPGFNSQQEAGKDFFLFATAFIRASGPYPMGNGGEAAGALH
jgi:hypothetical protein